MWRRIWLNLFGGWFQLNRWFPKPKMKFIRDVITEGERHHAGELCFAVEARYSLMALLNGIHSRQRAEMILGCFSPTGILRVSMRRRKLVTGCNRSMFVVAH